MSKSNLHIKDALGGVSPGMLLASQQTATLGRSLRALVGREAASRLLNHVGRTGLLRMSARELATAAKIELSVAQHLVAARQLFEACRHASSPRISSSDAVMGLLPIGLGSLETEVLLAIALDARLRVIDTLLLAQGGAGGAAVTPRDVFTPLVRLSARCFVLVHNHPSGSTAPSEDDITLTRELTKLGDALDVRLIDHVIVGGNETASFADLGLLPASEELSRLEVRRGR